MRQHLPPRKGSGCTWRGRGLSKWVISRVRIRVTPFRALIALLITYLLSPVPFQVNVHTDQFVHPYSNFSIIWRSDEPTVLFMSCFVLQVRTSSGATNEPHYSTILMVVIIVITMTIAIIIAGTQVELSLRELPCPQPHCWSMFQPLMKVLAI